MYREPQKYMYCLISGQELNEVLQALAVITKELNALARNEGRKQSEKLKEEWIGSLQVMSLLNIKKGTLQNLRDKGILPFSTVSGKFYYKASDIRNLLESNYTHRRGKSNLSTFKH